jgi:hypothetical protein
MRTPEDGSSGKLWQRKESVTHGPTLREKRLDQVAPEEEEWRRSLEMKDDTVSAALSDD